MILNRDYYHHLFKSFFLIASLLLFSGCIGGKSQKEAEKRYNRAHEMERLTQLEMNCVTYAECDEYNKAKEEYIKNNKHKTDDYTRANVAAQEGFKELDNEVGAGVTDEEPIDEIPSELLNEKPIEVEDIGDTTIYVKEAEYSKDMGKYPLLDGVPVWVHSPYYSGNIGGVGVGPKKSGGYAAQRRVAMVQAQADIARSIRVDVTGELVFEGIVISNSKYTHIVEKLNMMSTQEAREVLSSVKVEDEWIDEQNGDLYIWLIVPIK